MRKMVEVKTSDLQGAALNFAVSQADGRRVCLRRGGTYGAPQSLWYVAILLDGRKYDPVSDWAVGGPMIEKHQIELAWNGVDGEAFWWEASHQDLAAFQMGDTILIAACRAIVAANRGDTVMVPAELVEVAS